MHSLIPVIVHINIKMNVKADEEVPVLITYIVTHLFACYYITVITN